MIPVNPAGFSQLTPSRVVIIQNQLGEEIRELEGRGFSSPSPGIRKFTASNINDNGANFNFYDTSSSPKLERFDIQEAEMNKDGALRNSFKILDPKLTQSASKFTSHTNPISFRYGEKTSDTTVSRDPLERGFSSVTGTNPIYADTRSYQSITPSLPRDPRILNSPSYDMRVNQDVQTIKVPQGNIFGNINN